jgi:hypothetical protein
MKVQQEYPEYLEYPESLPRRGQTCSTPEGWLPEMESLFFALCPTLV